MKSPNIEAHGESNPFVLPNRFPSLGDEVISANLISRVVAALAIYSVVRNLIRAASKPLWFDELLTQAVSRQPNLSALWNVLKNGVDGNPPLFYLIERVASKLVSNEMIAYRIVPALAFACIVICIYAFVRKRSGASVALICTVLLFVTPLSNKYALEARPYSLLAACLALALVCYQRLPAAPWTIGLFLSLSVAESLHYYAGVACFPFFVAELVYVVTTMRIRRAVWLSMIASLIPAILSVPLLLKLKHAYAGHIWARPEFMLIPMSYGGYFRLNALWGMAIAIASFYVVARAWLRGRPPSEMSDAGNVALPSEHALVLGFLCLPAFGILAAKLAHGGATDRYYLPAIFGIVIALGYVLRAVTPAGFKLAAAIVLIAFAFQEADIVRSFSNNPGAENERAPILRLLSEAASRNNLRLVISDAGQYVELSHGAPPSLNQRMSALVDPPSAVAYSGTDTVDKLVIELQCCISMQVNEFNSFAAAHPVFLLYSDGTAFDWWPNRLMHDGAVLQLVARQGGGTLYRVALNPEAQAIP
jgi:Dolichyl-phosphate-mannose-protein mannosyltransferase